ncbi:S49 family peptidase [Entomomonas asaccharolytica]|uniref:S49 family peptidase n=1 Tax=Entomomonas asaccharolytica TaxID=2785331 RepID=A0A974NGY7_9GAMM|nr:S49 family peptidase [Entomomonas asaccharolytica]QQP86352.1 S49 family peptidase [Entomomonas asaccharolytica]
MSEELQTQISANDEKSWKLLEKTLQASLIEQRRSRRWGIFFKLLTFFYLFILIAIAMGAFKGDISTSTSHTAVIDLRGMIADQTDASADNLVTGLRAAFKDSNTKAVIIRINSPGGTPVQAGYVYDEIKRLRALYPQIKVYAVITDLGASGAYYIASAADEIYADKASLVGSIGVTAAGFGFVDAMHKLGIERRAYTSGEHKAFLDPFQPMNKEETEFWKNTLNTVHLQFINQVKAGRGDRLKDKEHPELFSGLIWSGEQAKELGLIDGFGSTSYVAREIVGEENLKNFTVQDSPFDRFAKKLGASAAKEIGTAAGLQGVKLQ